MTAVCALNIATKYYECVLIHNHKSLCFKIALCALYVIRVEGRMNNRIMFE